MPLKATRLEALFAELRSAEHYARRRLLVGFAEDTAKIECFFEYPMRNAQQEALDALATVGCLLEPDLAKNLRREAFNRIGVCCIKAVLANTAIRVRARFRIYARELVAAENRIEEAVASMGVPNARRYVPRMFPIQRLHLGPCSIPEPPDCASGVSEWIEALHVLARDRIERCMDVAVARVLSSGRKRLGVVKKRIDLALAATPLGMTR